MNRGNAERSHTDLEARARRLEDMEQIRRLTAAYKQALDGKDVVAYADLFAEAGTLWCTPELQATGRTAIRSLVDGMSGNLLTDEVGSDFHATANALIEVDGDRGTGTSTWLYFTVSDDGNPRIAKIGHYADHYIREDGCWRFHRRDAITDIPSV